MRTLLLAPVIVSALLLIAFPKLITGDFLEARVVAIESYDDGVAIEMAMRMSSGTDWGVGSGGGPLSSMGTSSSEGWSGVVPTWPKHHTIVVNLGVRRDKLPPGIGDLREILAVEEGQTHRMTPGRPLNLMRVKDIHGEEADCRIHARSGSRLGL